MCLGKILYDKSGWLVTQVLLSLQMPKWMPKKMEKIRTKKINRTMEIKTCLPRL